MGSYSDASRKHRDYRPRLSQSPQPGGIGYPVSGCPTPDQSDEERTEECKIEAKEAHDTLIQMGGRPTRPIEYNPRWKRVMFEGELCYQYAELKETLFHDEYHGHSKRDLNFTWTEAEFILGHWAAESSQFQEELRRWQVFRSYVATNPKHRHEFATQENMEHERYPHDPQLAASLKKLNDWKDYQALFQKSIDKSKQISERDRQAVEAIQRKDPEVVANKGKVRGRYKEDWLRNIKRQDEWRAAEKKRLEWVKQQLPMVLSECAASLMGRPTSYRQMEERSEFEAKELFNALVETGGRPSRPIRPVSDNQESDLTEEPFHVLCHWQGECSQFVEELRQWKKFLDYRQKNEADGRTELKEQPAASSSQVDLWEDYRAYQQLEVDKAKQWVKFWQRQVQNSQEEAAGAGDSDMAYSYRSEAEKARSYGEEMRKQVRPAELQLEWVEKQLALLVADHAASTTQASKSDRQEGQDKQPRRSSRLRQSTIKNLRPSRYNKSTQQSNQDKKKNQASVDRTLGQVHPSRVSKAAARKAPRRQRQSKTSTEHNDCQNQDPDTTISHLLSTNATLRRSSRLSNNEKRSGTPDASPAVNLGNSIRSSPIVLRRSDRVSKQKGRTKTSIAGTVMNPAVLSQTASPHHPPWLKSKGRRAGNKSGLSSSSKPQGISKRQKNNFPRNRNKINT